MKVAPEPKPNKEAYTTGSVLAMVSLIVSVIAILTCSWFLWGAIIKYWSK